jgi:hypothetical protein
MKEGIRTSTRQSVRVTPSFRRYLTFAAVALGTTASALIVVEGMLRVIVERPVLASEWLLPRPRWPDDDVIFSPPKQRVDARYELVEGLASLVALGDSFTKGYPVGREAGYPSVMRRLLLERGTPMNVVELGMGDTGPDQQLRAFERELLARMTPDVVVWQFYPNDVWDNGVKATYGIQEGALVPLGVTRNWLYQRQQAYSLVPFRDALRKRSYLFRYAIKGAERRQTSVVPASYGGDVHRWGLDKIRLEVDRMQTLGRTRGIRTYFVLVAPQAAYLDPQKRSGAVERFVRTYERMHELLRKEPGFIDARFGDSDDTALADDLFAGADRDLVDHGGRHYNEHGYRLLAELVLARLVADGVVAAR